MFLKSRQNRLYATSMKRLCIARGNEACTDSNSKNVKQHISWYMYSYHVLVHVTIKKYCTNVFTTYVIADKILPMFLSRCGIAVEVAWSFFPFACTCAFWGSQITILCSCSRYLNIWLLVFHLSNEYPKWRIPSVHWRIPLLVEPYNQI